MRDLPALCKEEKEARHELVALAEAMLSLELPFIEGAVQVLRLLPQLGGVGFRDPDFDAFVLIESETDHLPLRAQRPLWQAAALERLEPELQHTQEWASSFAPAACQRLLARFGSAS